MIKSIKMRLLILENLTGEKVSLVISKVFSKLSHLSTLSILKIMRILTLQMPFSEQRIRISALSYDFSQKMLPTVLSVTIIFTISSILSWHVFIHQMSICLDE